MNVKNIKNYLRFHAVKEDRRFAAISILPYANINERKVGKHISFLSLLIWYMTKAFIAYSTMFVDYICAVAIMISALGTSDGKSYMMCCKYTYYKEHV